MNGMNHNTGKSITDLKTHVSQSIGDILSTPVGSRVMRRDYGSVLPDLVDEPLNATTLLRVYAATAAAVMRWEPRFKISHISLSFQAPAGALVEVTGTLGNNDTLSTQTRIGGGL